MNVNTFKHVRTKMLKYDKNTHYIRQDQNTDHMNENKHHIRYDTIRYDTVDLRALKS